MASKTSASANSVKCEMHHSLIVGRTFSKDFLTSDSESLLDVQKSFVGVIEYSFNLNVEHSMNSFSAADAFFYPLKDCIL